MDTKYCSGCENDKGVIDFWKNKSTKDGLQSWCKNCWKTSTTKRRNGPKREIELRQRQNRHLVRTFNLTIEKYEEMLEEQNGGCAICGLQNEPDGKKLAVDHNAVTGVIRGILCQNCNRAIGQLNHDTNRLASAIEYLNRWW